MNNIIEDRLKNVMSAVFEMPEEKIQDNSSPDTIVSWDSLKHMKMVVALEEEFAIEFTDDEIIELINYSLIKNIISGKI